jgi:N-acetylmuramic acid 6-phosphate etherase
VVATNHKLRDRTLRILAEVTGEPEAANAALLANAGGDLRIAIVSSVSGAPVDRAAAALEESAGSIPVAIELARARAAR